MEGVSQDYYSNKQRKHKAIPMLIWIIVCVCVCACVIPPNYSPRGQGLGKMEDGMVAHLRTEKKVDAGGVGIEAVALAEREQTNVWWHDAFSGALKNLDVGGKKKKKAKKPKTEGREEAQSSAGLEPPSFDELFKATGGARLGMRARRRQTGKLERSDHVKLSADDAASCQDNESKAETRANLSEVERAAKDKRKDEKRRLKRERYEENAAAEVAEAADSKPGEKKQRKSDDGQSSEAKGESESTETEGKCKEEKIEKKKNKKKSTGG